MSNKINDNNNKNRKKKNEINNSNLKIKQEESYFKFIIFFNVICCFLFVSFESQLTNFGKFKRTFPYHTCCPNQHPGNPTYRHQLSYSPDMDYQQQQQVLLQRVPLLQRRLVVNVRQVLFGLVAVGLVGELHGGHDEQQLLLLELDMVHICKIELIIQSNNYLENTFFVFYFTIQSITQFVQRINCRRNWNVQFKKKIAQKSKRVLFRKCQTRNLR